MRKQLGFEKPLISYEPSVNHITGIIASDFERYQCAFYNNFIDIEVAGSVDFYRLKDWQRYGMFVTFQIPKDFICDRNYENIINIIKSWIAQGRYVLISLETFYVSNYSSYHSYYFCHYAMIMGYDDYKKTFICGDFFDFEHYKVEDCFMNEIVDAILYNDRTQGEFAKNFMLLKVDGQSKPLLDLNRIIMSLCMLLVKNNTSMENKYGLFIFEKIIEMIDVENFQDNYIEFRRHAHFLLAHMEAMLLRVRYISKINRDKKFSKILFNIMESRKEAEQYRNYILKLHIMGVNFFPESSKEIYIKKLHRVKQIYEKSIRELIFLLERM